MFRQKPPPPPAKGVLKCRPCIGPSTPKNGLSPLDRIYKLWKRNTNRRERQ